MSASTLPTPGQVTVVIPTYRRPGLLRRAIASAVEQEGVDVRVHVFDNCSGDETAEVVAGFARRHPGVVYHCHERNLGAGANFEAGMRSVRTPYFSLLSDDDYLLPGIYRHALADFAAHPEAMFWAGTTLQVGEDGRIWDARLLRWPREGLHVPPDGLKQMLGGLAPTWTGVVFRRDALDVAGMPDWDMLGPSDLDYLLRIAARHPFLLSKHASAAFMLNPDSFSARQTFASFWPGWEQITAHLTRLPGVTEPVRAELLGALEAFARKMLLRRGAYALAHGRADFARDAAKTLVANYGAKVPAGLLRALAWTLASVPGAQRAYSAAYRRAEGRIVASRAELQSRFGHLLRDG